MVRRCVGWGVREICTVVVVWEGGGSVGCGLLGVCGLYFCCECDVRGFGGVVRVGVVVGGGGGGIWFRRLELIRTRWSDRCPISIQYHCHDNAF